MTELAHTSVPGWAVAAAADVPVPNVAGTACLLVGVGADAAPVVEEWRAAAAHLPATAVRTILAEDGPAAAVRLTEELDRATVGVRVLLAGPAGTCLAVRAAAFNAGLEDDEIAVSPTGMGAIDLFCVHCRRTAPVVAAIDEVVPCTCGRNLIVHHHVSRSSGRFLGFMVDAEEQCPDPVEEG